MNSQFTPVALDRLIAAHPLERMLSDLDSEVAVRRRRFTHPYASVELELLESFRAQLRDASQDARSTEIYGNVKDAARLLNRSESTVRRICKKYREAAGAKRIEGEYQIHLPTFLRFEPQRQVQSKNAVPVIVPGRSQDLGSTRRADHHSRFETKGAA